MSLGFKGLKAQSFAWRHSMLTATKHESCALGINLGPTNLGSQSVLEIIEDAVQVDIDNHASSPQYQNLPAALAGIRQLQRCSPGHPDFHGILRQLLLLGIRPCRSRRRASVRPGFSEPLDSSCGECSRHTDILQGPY